MKERVIVSTERISNVMLSKHGYGHDCLYFEFDGRPVEVDGEFYIDSDGYLHETFTDDDGNDFFIKVLYSE